jgi:hypothetical protein
MKLFSNLCKPIEHPHTLSLVVVELVNPHTIYASLWLTHWS